MNGQNIKSFPFLVENGVVWTPPEYAEIFLAY